MPADGECVDESWLAKLNLPQVVLGRAGSALSEIVGSAVDIPKARLERISDKIRAETKRQINFDDKVHDSVTALALNERAFVDRAYDNQTRRLLKGQLNREKIAKIALAELNHKKSSAFDEETESVSEDWLNQFSGHAESISTEKMQLVWGGILSGEIQSPGSYSLSTLRFFSELDKLSAEKISGLLNHVFMDSLLLFPSGSNVEGSLSLDLLELESMGLVTGVSSGYGIAMPVPENKVVGHKYEEGYFQIACRDHVTKIELPSIVITRLGREVLTILPRKTIGEFVRHLIPLMRGKFTEIRVFQIPETGGSFELTETIGRPLK